MQDSILTLRLPRQAS